MTFRPTLKLLGKGKKKRTIPYISDRELVSESIREFDRGCLSSVGVSLTWTSACAVLSVEAGFFLVAFPYSYIGLIRAPSRQSPTTA